MTLLTVLGAIAGYVMIGAFYARSRAVAAHKKAEREWGTDAISERYVRESVSMMLAWRLAAWPYAMVYDQLGGGISGWLRGPINERKARAEQLRADAAEWSWRAGEPGATEAEREMARELARILGEMAKEAKP